MEPPDLNASRRPPVQVGISLPAIIDAGLNPPIQPLLLGCEPQLKLLLPAAGGRAAAMAGRRSGSDRSRSGEGSVAVRWGRPVGYRRGVDSRRLGSTGHALGWTGPGNSRNAQPRPIGRLVTRCYANGRVDDLLLASTPATDERLHGL
jgi:hypothetical protein